MYPVSEAFLSAVQENTRRYYWTGKITTKAGVVHEFSEKEIVKGSGYISSQCCGSTEMELGTVYASEMGITLFSEIDRYTLEDALVELYYHLLVVESYETVPMGIYEISEANRTIRCLEIKAYDYMLRFEKDFNTTDTIGNAYEIIMLCCKACSVEFAHGKEPAHSLPPGGCAAPVELVKDDIIRFCLFHFKSSHIHQPRVSNELHILRLVAPACTGKVLKLRIEDIFRWGQPADLFVRIVLAQPKADEGLACPGGMDHGCFSCFRKHGPD